MNLTRLHESLSILWRSPPLVSAVQSRTTLGLIVVIYVPTVPFIEDRAA